MEITVHTGFAGDRNKFNIDWYDHNNVRQKTVVEVNVNERDKPRTLSVIINGVVLGEIRSDETQH